MVEVNFRHSRPQHVVGLRRVSQLTEWEGSRIGAGVTWIVEQVPLPVNGIFKTDHFIVVRDPNHYLAAIATAVVMVMIASLFPARRAARLEPGDIIRGTAQ